MSATRPGFAILRAGFLLAVGLVPTLSGQQIDQFLRVDDRVWTGGRPTPEQLARLQDAGVRTVIDLIPGEEHDLDAERSAARELGLGFVSLPVRAADPTPEQADAFLAITADAGIYPILLHCASGNRAGAFWMIRRMLVDGWPEPRAEEEARRIGLKSPNLLDFAREYVREHAREK